MEQEFLNQNYPENSKKKRTGHTFSTAGIVALALCCSLLGGAMGVGGMLWWNSGDRGGSDGNISHVLQGNRENSVIDTVQIDTSKLMTAAQVYAANVNSTVGITTSTTTTNFWGYQTTSAASGSGLVYTADGYILTNYHVVQGSDSITVTMYDGKTYDGALVGYLAEKDIAVLKIQAQQLTPVVLGDAENLNVGDGVVAIGNPLGELTFSLTTGAVSAKERKITMSNGATMNLLQTDCAINSGNSGGGLFNMYGELIGITNAKYSSSSYTEASIDNIGFAIPINQVRSVVDSIIEQGYVTKPYLGVSLTDVGQEAQLYGLPQGAAVRSVAKDSPAEKGGLQANDIITQINGETITSSADVTSLVGEAEAGSLWTVTVYRKGQTLQLQITIGEQIQSATEQNTNQSSSRYPGRG